MEDMRQAAQAEVSTYKRMTQRERIFDKMQKDGFITMLEAFTNVSVRITKLATRISEIEHDCGHRFVHEPMYRMDGGRRVRYNTRYSVPAGMTLEDFKSKQHV